MSVMMKCGHSAQGKNSKGDPVCVICFGIVSAAEQVNENPPSFEGRMAKCISCRSRQESSSSLAFFRHWRDRDEDEFYCGCHGWD
jgi:hypothetical protein